MPWRPSEPGELPTLGWVAIDWMTEYLAAPDSAEYRPFVPYREQEDFLLEWYRVDPETGRFVYRNGLLGRPRGWGKSPLLGAVSLLEFCGPIVFDGWDADGQPVGRPWSSVRTPNVHVVAVSEEQVRENTWGPLLEMASGPVADEYGLDALETQVTRAGSRGKVSVKTAASRSVKGGRPVLVVMDQTEAWTPGSGGVRLANTLRSNAAKIGGRTLESPNAFVPGEESVAEQMASFAEAIREGRARDDSLLYDHREAPGDTDITERESLVAGLRVSYGDSSGHPGGCVIHTPACPPGHVDLEPIVSLVWNPAQDVQVSRSDFLNQITHASDSWVSRPQVKAVDVEEMVRAGLRPESARVVSNDEPVVLGFDGSRGRNRGTADATALVGCRVEDGHIFTVRVWEQPAGPLGRDWAAPAVEVDAEVRSCMTRYRVVGFYADPSGWASYVASWEAAFGRKLRVKASQNSPIAAWPRSKDSRVVEYLERLRLAIVTRECSYDGSSELTRHLLNARRRVTRSGLMIYKSFPESPYKIDAAYAAMLAWKARTDALAAGIGRKRASRGRVTVMR